MKKYLSKLIDEGVCSTDLEKNIVKEELQKILHYQYLTCQHFEILHNRYEFTEKGNFSMFDLNSGELIEKVNQWKWLEYDYMPFRHLTTTQLFQKLAVDIREHIELINDIEYHKEYRDEISESLLFVFNTNYPFDYCFDELTHQMKEWAEEILKDGLMKYKFHFSVK